MKFEEIIKVNKEDFEVINRYLTVQPQTEAESQSEDDTIVYTAKFSDGKFIDIKCCGVQFDEDNDNTSWTEAVLFDQNGVEICCSDVCDYFLGKWELEDDGNKYIVHVILED